MSYFVFTTVDLRIVIPLHFYTATNKLEQFTFSQENSHQPYTVPDNTSKVLKFIFNNARNITLDFIVWTTLWHFEIRRCP